MNNIILLLTSITLLCSIQALGQTYALEQKAIDLNKVSQGDTISYFLYGNYHVKIIMDKHHRVSKFIPIGDTTNLKRTTKYFHGGVQVICFIDSMGALQGPAIQITRKNRLMGVWGYKQNLFHGLNYGYFRKTQKLRNLHLYRLEIPLEYHVFFDKGVLLFDWYNRFNPNELPDVEKIDIPAMTKPATIFIPSKTSN